MSTTEIEAITRLPLSEDLLGCHVDLPCAGLRTQEYKFDCAGWVLGKKAAVVRLDLLANDGPIRRVPILLQRPDVCQHYPEIPTSRAIGFGAPVSVLGLTPEFELQMQVVLDGNRRVQIGTIRGKHQPIGSSITPTIQPLMITSLGRTGTTWLMRLLSQHPAIVAYQSYPYEMRPGRYWMQLLSAITEPAAYAQSFGRVGTLDPQWWIAHHPLTSLSPIADSALREWFGFSFVDQTAELCQKALEHCYRQVASIQKQPGAEFFAEKHLPDEIPGIVWELYPNAREIFLIRDFRDMLCSIKAFNQKRGTSAFGRNLVADEKQYIEKLQGDALCLLKAWQNRRHKACMVRYEDLIGCPEKSLAEILAYLRLDASSAVIEKMIDRAAVDSDELRNHRTSSTSKDSVGRWQQELDPELKQFCQDSFRHALEEFGYVAEDSSLRTAAM